MISEFKYFNLPLAPYLYYIPYICPSPAPKKTSNARQIIISDMGNLKEKNINHFDFWQSNQFLDTRP